MSQRATQQINQTQTEFTQSSRGRTQSDQYIEKLDKGVVKKLIQDCIQYILYCCLAEKRALIKRDDLNKNILKEHRKGFLTVINSVKEELWSVFGFDLVDIDGKQEKFGVKTKFQYDEHINKFKIQATTKTNLEMLAQRHNNNNNDSFSQATNRQSSASAGAGENNEISDDEFQMYVKYTMLMISLSLIFMNNNELDANEFWNCLKRINISRNEKRHTFLGDVEKYFTQELVKEGYLEYEQIRGTEPPAYKFKWGYRAKLEISKSKILDFVCKMYGTCKPEDWNLQYEDAKKEEQDNNNNTSIINDTQM